MSQSFDQHLINVILPLLITNILHMVVVKLNLFSFLLIPISSKLFGENKTIRGFIFMTLMNGLTTILVSPLTFISGAILGFTYSLFELPNSLLKRKLGIKAGEKSEKSPILFFLIDRMDSTFGVMMVYTFIQGESYLLFFKLFFFGFGTHALFSVLLYKLGIKKSI